MPKLIIMMKVMRKAMMVGIERVVVVRVMLRMEVILPRDLAEDNDDAVEDGGAGEIGVDDNDTVEDGGYSPTRGVFNR